MQLIIIYNLILWTSQDDYDVLGRNETSLCISVDPSESVYGNLDEVRK